MFDIRLTTAVLIHGRCPDAFIKMKEFKTSISKNHCTNVIYGNY